MPSVFITSSLLVQQHSAFVQRQQRDRTDGLRSRSCGLIRVAFPLRQPARGALFLLQAWQVPQAGWKHIWTVWTQCLCGSMLHASEHGNVYSAAVECSVHRKLPVPTAPSTIKTAPVRVTGLTLLIRSRLFGPSVGVNSKNGLLTERWVLNETFTDHGVNTPANTPNRHECILNSQ